MQRVEFVSKEEGARWLEKALGNKGLFLDGENPLPNSFNIHPARGADVEKIAGQVRRVAGVDEVVYGRDFVRLLHLAVRLIWVLGFGLLFLVMLAVLYIVVNTIQMTVYARRKEIEIMKLVGATDWFIRWPFMLEGIILGIGGALIAVVIVLEAYAFLSNRLGQVSTVLSLLTRARSPLMLSAGSSGSGSSSGRWGASFPSRGILGFDAGRQQGLTGLCPEMDGIYRATATYLSIKVNGVKLGGVPVWIR